MQEYTSNTTWREVADRINAAERIALITHSKPDGDALGSLLGLARGLMGKGKSADIFTMGPIEPALRIIAADTEINRSEDRFPGDDYELIVIVDTGAWSQLEPLGDWLRKHRERIIVIDHHPQGDDVAALRMVDTDAGAAAEMMVTLLDELSCELTGGVGGIAEALYVGIGTDTGWFRYAGAKAATFETAARLLRCGVDKSRLFQIIEETYQPGRLELEIRAMKSLVYALDGSVAIQSLRGQDLDETDCTVKDLTGIVNLPMIVRQVRVSILLTQTEHSITKASFRAKPPLDGCWMLDVNEFAQRFGGGGHVHASGARIRLDIEEARKAVIEAIEE